jgi:hypothetical protein
MEKEDRKEFLMKEVEPIQGVINRMDSNSFLIKGWTLTLVVGTLLLHFKGMQIFIVFIPTLVFWILDSYYLRQQRLYRKLYDWVVENRMKTDENLFKMDTTRFKKKVDRVRIIFSLTLLDFYGLIIVLTIVYAIEDGTAVRL